MKDWTPYDDYRKARPVNVALIRRAITALGLVSLARAYYGGAGIDELTGGVLLIAALWLMVGSLNRKAR